MAPNKNTAAGPISVTQHMPVLDGVRGIAVLIVIGFHFWQLFAQRPYGVIGKLAVWGQTGVDLFFVLSGFLITGILLDTKGSEYFLRNFYVRRVLRIFPLYYATLIALYLVLPLLHLIHWTPWREGVWFWFYLQNIPMTFAPLLVSGPEHFWSLAVEEHYYLLWPFMVLLFSRKKLLKIIGIAIALSLLTRIVFIKYETFYFTLARLDGLAIGSAVAIYARKRSDGLVRYVPWAKRLLWGVGIVLAVTQLLLSGSGVPVVQVVKSTLISLVYACFLILAIVNRCGPLVAAVLTSRVLGSVGKYSYGMYVLHPFILAGLARTRLSYGFSGIVIGTVLTYAAAWISWTLVEKKFLRLKRHFEYSSRPEASSAVNRALPAPPDGYFARVAGSRSE